jgi:hypothetical protein
MTYFGYIEAVHYAAAKLHIQEYIGDELDTLDIPGWDFVHFFENDAKSVIVVGLYETLREPRPLPIVTFWLIVCRNGCYRLPTSQESEYLNATTTISN